MAVLVGEAAVDEAAFPSVWPQGDVVLPLTYEFDPGSEADGVTVDVPLPVLARVRPEGFDWLVPGLHEELAVALIRALPKALRVPLVPAPDAARAIVEWIRANEPSWTDTVRAADMAPSLASVLSRTVRALRGVEIADDVWDTSRLPPHLRMRFRAVEQRGRAVSVVDEGSDLVALQRRLAARAEDAVRSAVRSAVRTAMQEVADSGVGSGVSAGELAGVTDRPPGTPDRATNAPALERTDLRTWPAALPDGRIPEVITSSAGGLTVHAYPALVVGPSPLTTQGLVQIGASDAPNRARSRKDGGGVRAVDLRVLATAGDQERHHGAGVRELLVAEVGLATARITTRWTSIESLSLAASPYPSTAALVADLQRAAIDGIAAGRGVDPGAVRDADEYALLRSIVRDGLEDATYAAARSTAAVLTAARELDADVRATTSLALLSTVHDIRDQLVGLVHDGFVAEAGVARLPHLVRYLRAARYRLSKAAENPGRDESLAWQVAEVSDAYDDAVAAAQASAPDAARDARLEQARWLLEELRVSLFAQQLGTAQPVSAKRIRALLAT